MATIAMDETFRRLVQVETKVQAEGWSTATVQALTAEMGVNRATIYEYWRKVKAYTRRGVTLDLDKWRRQQMVDLDNIKMLAIRTSDLPSAINAIKVQAQIIGTIAPLKVEASVTHQLSPQLAAQMATYSQDQLRDLRDKQELAIPDRSQAIDADFTPVADRSTPE